jgi:AcrR family transcriptional regulator
VSTTEAAASGGKREATKQANRAAILAAARGVFAEIGFGAASVRDIIRRTDLAAGTFYNYFSTKEAGFRALVDEAARGALAATREARLAATSLEEFIHGGNRAYYTFVASDPATFDLMRRNAGTIRTMFDEPALGVGFEELREDLEAAIRRGIVPPHDTEYAAAAMVGTGFEVAVRMVERDPVDVEGAAHFATALFVGGIEALGRDGRS